MSVDTKVGGIYLANDCFNALLRSLQLEIRAVIKTSGFRFGYIYIYISVLEPNWIAKILLPLKRSPFGRSIYE